VHLSVGDHRSVACRDRTDTGIFYNELKSSKLVQGDLFLLCIHESLIALCMQDYKSLCTAVRITANLVNIQTYRILTSLYE